MESIEEYNRFCEYHEKSIIVHRGKLCGFSDDKLIIKDVYYIVAATQLPLRVASATNSSESSIASSRKKED